MTYANSTERATFHTQIGHAGGQPAHEGATPAGVPEGATMLAGVWGTDWELDEDDETTVDVEADDRYCGQPKADGEPCRAYATATGVCAGHQKQLDAFLDGDR